ncbi:MAG: ATP phosphoribosyltransferase regulatory subunit [Selenomonadaceae bacterium]|nr:ATP phosphoribosyltransferase regulatory subunit [Selenomonadaceae bacterium]
MSEILETPYGTRDFLPEEAAAKRLIENRLAEIFSKYGYEEVVTPAMEFLETLTMSGGRTVEKDLFKMFDQNNRTLALHHEMTTPIARLAASRLKNSALPLKLSYNTNVFRFRRNQPGRQCEFYQAGVELLGISNAAADAEIISLAVESLKSAGLKEFKICLGQVEFASGLMEQNNLSFDEQKKIKSAIERHDIVELEKISDSLNLDKNSADALKKIPQLHGGKEILETAEKLAENKKSLSALENLSEIYRLLEIYGTADKIIFDLGIIRDFEYYTGMIFEAYAPNVGYSLAGGGRYDHMLKDFGLACPATGFALGIERILLARKMQGIYEDVRRKNIYLSYAEGKIDSAIKKASELREAGKVVEISLTPQTKDDAEIFKQKKGYDEMIYIDMDCK